jgi:hypothetical protein
MGWIEVLHEHEGHSQIGRQGFKEICVSFQSAGGNPQRNHGEGPPNSQGGERHFAERKSQPWTKGTSTSQPLGTDLPTRIGVKGTCQNALSLNPAHYESCMHSRNKG